MKQRRIKGKGCVAVLLVAGFLAGCGDVNYDQTAVTMGDITIPYGVVAFGIRYSQASTESYVTMYGMDAEDYWKEKSDGERYDTTLKNEVVEMLEEDYLLQAHMGDYGVELTDAQNEEIAKAVEKFSENNTLENKEIIAGDDKYVEEYLRVMTVANQVETKIKEGISVEVSDEEAAQKGAQYVEWSYTTTDAEGNAVELSDEEKESLRKTAEEVAEALQADPQLDFTTYAQEKGLTVQTMTFDSETESPDTSLIEALDALETEGSATEVIETDTGLYVGKLTTLLDRTATDEKKQTLLDEKKEEQYDDTIESWKEDVKIQVNKGLLKKINLVDQGITAASEASEYDTQ